LRCSRQSPHKRDELVPKNVIPQATYNRIKGQIIAGRPGNKKSAREGP
jgi:hypothetical protein